MKKSIYKTYEDERIEAIKDRNGSIVIKDKSTEKYLFLKGDTELTRRLKWSERYSMITDIAFTTYIVVLVVFSLVNVTILVNYDSIFGRLNQDKTVVCIIMSLVYICINGVFHEMGHILALKRFGRKNGKIGLKFNYIFPALYVNVNETYLLTKEEKIVVHSAGIFTNLFVNICATIFFISYFDTVFQYVYPGIVSIAWSVVYNTLPFFNSDGYKIMITIIDEKEFNNRRKNSKLVNLIKIINLLFSLVYLTIAITDMAKRIFQFDFYTKIKGD